MDIDIDIENICPDLADPNIPPRVLCDINMTEMIMQGHGRDEVANVREGDSVTLWDDDTGNAWSATVCEIVIEEDPDGKEGFIWFELG